MKTLESQKIKVHIRYISWLVYLLPLALITGPFISDLFVSIIAIHYIFFSIKEKLWKDYNNIFIYLFFIFYFYILSRSILSESPYLSLESSLFYFRYIFFVMGISYLVKNNFFFIDNLFKSFLIIFFALIFDAYIQFFFGKNIFGWPVLYQESTIRISGLFYDEYVLGNYIARIMPIIFGIFFLINNQKKYSFILAILFILSIILTLLTGDRTGFFLYLLSTATIATLVRGFFLQKLILLFISLITIFCILMFNSTIKERVLNLTLNQIAVQEDHQYIFTPAHDAYFRSSLLMIEDNFLFGHGPKMYRELCKKEIYKKTYFKKDNCSTHPHNTYIQLLLETGFIGFMFVLSLFAYIAISYSKHLFITIFSTSNRNLILTNAEICFFAAIFVSLWPLAPTLNFFNNWISIIYYIPFGFILYKFDLKI